MNLSNLLGTLSSDQTTTAPAASSGLFGFLNTAVGTAAQVYTATQDKKNAALTKAAAAATDASNSNTTRTWLLLAAAAGLVVLLLTMMFRRSK